MLRGVTWYRMHLGQQKRSLSTIGVIIVTVVSHCVLTGLITNASIRRQDYEYSC